MTARDQRSVAEREDTLQGAVLGLLVFAHPGQFSVEELVRELTDRPDEFTERDAMDNACVISPAPA